MKLTIISAMLLQGIALLTTSAQNSSQIFFELDHPDTNSEMIDFSKLDTYFENVRVVGMGESTHGTHEFFEMRSRMFKYLVEEHDFNTFFLEADYANCLRINDYISGTSDSVENVVRELGLWPWITEEMVALTEWMRDYNLSGPDRKISFLGVDMQAYNPTLGKIDEILVKYGMPVTDTIIYPGISDLDFIKLKKKKTASQLMELVEAKKSADTKAFSLTDRLTYENLVRHLEQSVDEKMSKISQFRDVKMGENVLKHLQKDPTIKGFFWGHNWHISNFYWGGKKGGTAGGTIRKSIGNKYFSIGQDFDQGSFNAYVPGPDSNHDSKDGWSLISVTVNPAPEGSLVSNFRGYNKSVIFVPFNSLPKSENVYISYIGATYQPSTKEKPISRYNHHGRESFDAMIVFKQSTPTTLISKE